MSIVFTIGFCIVIFCIGSYFIFQASKLRKARIIIERKLSESNILASINESVLKGLNGAYQRTLTINSGHGTKTNTPSSNYFSEWNIANAYKINLRFLDSASGTLVGLGLFGTFLGLTIGILGFDSSNSENIQNSIQALLDGMSTAFFTSLAGMAMSILYTLYEKPCRNKFARAISALDERLDNEYYIDDISFLGIQEEYFCNSIKETVFQTINHQTNSLQNSIRQYIDTSVTNLSQKIETFETTIKSLLIYTNEAGDNIILANAIREILKESQQQSKALKSFSTDLALELNQGFDEVLSRQMQQKIIPLMESVDATTRAVIEHIDQMSANVSSPATDMIQSIVGELKNSMLEMVEGFRTSVSSSTAKELEQLAISLGNAGTAISDFPKSMEVITNTLQSTIGDIKNAVSEISDTSANANARAMQQMQEQITFATTSISNAITEVREVMGAMTHSSRQHIDDAMSKMNDATERMGEFMSNMMEKVSSSVNDTMANVANDMIQKQMDLMSIQEAMVKEIQTSVKTMSESSVESTSGIIDSLSQAQSTMGNFMQSTVGQITASVKDSMQSIASDITDKQTAILEFQESTLQETKRLLDSFNIALDRLERTNEYITGTMDTFQKAQGEISGSTANLRNITGDMKIVTETFNRSQSDYAKSLSEIQKHNQSNIDSITSLVHSSSEMSEDYVKKFETIKSGLAMIFAQIQTGLNEYTRTVQSSLQSFLGDYTSSLTKTTESLSNTIQLQNDVVESLTEAMNKRK